MNQEIRDKISKWTLCRLVKNGERKVGAFVSDAEMDEARAFIEAHKEEILAELDAMEEERRKKDEEQEKHLHMFYCFGWECHTCVIDDREDLEQQFEGCAGDDISAEDVKKAYFEQLAKEAAKEAAKAQTKEDVKAEPTEEPFEIRNSRQSKFLNGDGFYDYEAYVTIRDKKTGEDVAFKEMNVFDFGRVSCPVRYVGKQEAAHPEMWTELERQMDAWFVKHSIVGTGMRM